MDSSSIISDYINKNDWRVQANSNSTYSLQGLMQHISNIAVERYWLNDIYTKEVRDAVYQNRMYIHDLGWLSAYCCGWSLADLLANGFGGVDNKINCSPPKHFDAALGQLVNFFFTMQGEMAGAQAVSNFDTLLAPLASNDNLSDDQLFKSIQSFVYSLNVPTRSGFQAPFTNISMDLTCPSTLADTEVTIGGKLISGCTYSQYQKYMTKINQAFCKVMLEGDAKGTIFTFPIPTYNVGKDFNWDDPENARMWEMTAKYGTPYFANFINSSLRPEDCRSMCCRLRLDVSKLQTRTGGLFGSAPLTGSLGVVTINLPHLAVESEGDLELFKQLIHQTVEVAALSLDRKRNFVEGRTDCDLYPYAKVYLRDIKKKTGHYWTNHFSTIGVIGCDDAFQILFKGKGIAECGTELVDELVLDPIIAQLEELQTKTYPGTLFNLEATPCESATTKMAMTDQRLFADRPDVKIPNYYTNSTMLPPNSPCKYRENLEIQAHLQSKYTGGTVFHIFTKDKIATGKIAKNIIKDALETTNLPYITLSPTFSICQKHGYLSGARKECCGAKLLTYSRVVGYYRPVQDWNVGKKEEFSKRTTFDSYIYNVPIAGVTTESFIDFPGKCTPSTVLYLKGCNLKCQWCHNANIAWNSKENTEKLLDAEQVLEDTQNDDLVICGGEPLVQSNIIEFLREVKRVNPKRLVKLDTNGTKPDVLAKILNENLVDAVAVDIKSSPANYSKVCGGVDCWDCVELSLKMLEKKRNDDNLMVFLRTTVVDGLVDIEDLEEIRDKVVAPQKHHWTLQQYEKSDGCVKDAPESMTDEHFAEIKKAINILE